MEMNPTVSPLNNFDQRESFTKTTDVLFDPSRNKTDGNANFRADEIVEESLVVDLRSELSPAELVENKLTRILRDSSMPVSHMQVRGLLRSR